MKEFEVIIGKTNKQTKTFPKTPGPDGIFGEF